MREVHRHIADAIYQSDRFEPMVEQIRAAGFSPPAAALPLPEPVPPA